MTDPTPMPDSFRAALTAALSRPLLLDPRAYDPLLDAGGFRPRVEASASGSSSGERQLFDRAEDVAIVDISGPLAQRAWSCWVFDGDGYDAIAQRVRAALDDRATRSVVLRIDSPGGEVAGCFEAVRAIRGMARAAGKPVLAYVDELACSAAYALACACDEIVLPDTGTVGSVGVILSVSSHAEAMKQRGVSVALITSGAAKADGHPAIALSDEARGRLQADVDQLAQVFAAEVAASRPFADVAQVLSLQAQTFIGAQAVRGGLADHVGAFGLALERARARATRSPSTAARGASPTPTRKNIMNEQQLAALAAATGETDHDKIVAAVTTTKTKLEAAEGSITKLSTDLAAAHERAAAAEKSLDDAARAREIDAAKAGGQWSPALDGFLATLSTAQLQSWRASAPRVVPEGEIKPPSGGPQVTKGTPADVAAAITKAESEGWNALSGTEKSLITRHSRTIADSLRAAPRR